jgi:TolB-like protein/Tfp pilus assembly protein PilF
VTAPSTPLAEALRDRYVIERELGRGGMATVYLARDLKHDRPVALKVLRPDLGQALGPERFLREIRLTARLDHPHILPVLDSGETAGQLWYAMPYVRGESLRDRLRREVQLPIDSALDIARQVGLALDYAHREGIVHRDLKPENILLANSQPRVADFGVAKALASGTNEKLTETGMALGTPAYMSPEQAVGDSVDGRTDIYALGCVLYEMLAGEPPYSGRTVQALIARRLTEPVPSLRTLRASVPVAVEQTVSRALAKTPADRYPTASDFVYALAIAESEPVAHSLRRRGRERAWVAGVALAGVGLLGIALWYRSGLGRAPITSLAVLPLTTARADTSTEYLGEGLTETLINNLSRLPQLRIIPRSTVFWYKERGLSALDLGHRLGVGAVLTWNLSRHGSNLLIQSELLRVSDGSRLWGDQYDRPFADVLAVQEEIARLITERLKLQLTDKERGRLAQRPTQEAEAYDLYARGRYFWLHGLFASRALFERSRTYFEQAIAADSTFAPAWVGLAEYNGASAGQGFLPIDAWAKADTLTRRALALDPNLAEAYNSLAADQFFYYGDWSEGERQIRKAIALQPGYGEAHRVYGQYLWRSGHLGQALTELRRAVALEPYVAVMHIRSGEALQLSGDSGAAIQEYRRALELDPSSGLAQDRLARAYATEGMYAEAVKVPAGALRARGEVERAAALEQAYASLRGSAGYRQAERLQARWELERLKAAALRERVEAEQFVHVYVRAGDWGRAVTWLQRAAQDHPGRLRWLLTEPELQPLDTFPADIALRRSVGLLTR